MFSSTKLYTAILGVFIVCVLAFTGFNYYFFEREIQDAIYQTTIIESKKRLSSMVESVVTLSKNEGSLVIDTAKKKVKEEVENAWRVANSIYLYCKKRGCSDETTKLLIKNALSKIRFFEGKGYIFIDSVKGKVILNPGYPQIEGKSMWNWKDIKGNYVHRKFEEVVLYSPTNSGFVSYYWYLPHTDKPDLKISYVKLFKPYNWIIGAGVYSSYVRERVKKHVLKILSSINIFIRDLDENNLSDLDFLKNFTLDELEKGVLVNYRDKIYYFKYFKKWNWIVGSYVTDNELLQTVYLLREQFLAKINVSLGVSSALVAFIVIIASLGLYKTNRDLLKLVQFLKKREKQLRNLSRKLKLTAYKDDVTGLSNRKKFLEDVFSLREKTRLHFALVNIRNFRDINELFGYDEGNKILKKFGYELRRVVKKKNKTCLVYRIRGDKFGVLGCGFNDAAFVDFIQKVLRNLEVKDFSVKDINFRLDVVAGISKNPDNFLIESEMAEEEAKKRGIDLYIFDEDLERSYESLEKNVKIATELKKALEENRVVPFFQPIVDLKLMKPFEYEVLMRIVDSGGNYLNPGEFLPVAKKISIYRRLSKTVLEKAFEIAVEKGINISVNLSAEDITGSSMVDWIITAIRHYGIGERVCFEVVETEAFSDIKSLENFYFKIKELGSSLAIDDFGSGYSNYEYLATVKPDFIKIDGSLITKVVTSKEIEKLVSHIVQFAKDLEIKTVAEFVSSEEILNKVKEIGVDYGQGFYLGKPSPEIPEG